MAKTLIDLLSGLVLSLFTFGPFIVVQNPTFRGNNGSSAGTLTLPVGWRFIQDKLTLSCTAGNASCPGGSYPTTAGSVRIVMVGTGNDTTITSVDGGTSSTFSACPSSKCHAFSAGHGGVDAVIAFDGGDGDTSYTVHLSGASATVFHSEFVELMPPPGFTASIDDVNAVVSPGCSTACPTAPLTLTGTDAVIQLTPAASIIALAGPFTFGSPYTADGSGSGLALNVTSAPATTFGFDPQSNGGSSWIGTVGIALRSTAGTFTVSSPFTWVNFATTYILGLGMNCSPTCPTFTIPSTGTNNLLFLAEAHSSGRVMLTVNDSVNTWTVPTGANTCQLSNAVGGMSCAWVLQSVAGDTGFTVTMSGSGTSINLVYFEVARPSGNFALNAQGSTANVASVPEIYGQSLAAGCTGCSNAASGVNSVMFAMQEIYGGPDGFTLMPFPYINKGTNAHGGGYTFSKDYANVGLLLNTTSGAAPFGRGPAGPSNVASVMFQ